MKPDDSLRTVLQSLDVKDQRIFTSLVSAASFEETMKKFSGPRQSLVLQRFQFRQRAQLPGENFTTFALALQDLASVCAFGCWQEELILDQLINKAADWRIREKLLMELGTLTLAQAVKLGSQMERVLQKPCPAFISALPKQWENWSGTTNIWKIRNDNCCNHCYYWGKKIAPALTTKYDQEKQNQFTPSCHSSVSSAPVMGRQHLLWDLRYSATSHTKHRRVRNLQVGF